MKNKKLTVALTLVVAAALALTGSFAWYSGVQEATNIAETTEYKVELVDIFDGTTVPNGDEHTVTGWSKNATLNKDIYVKNTATAGEGSILVRVKLDEILTIGGTDALADRDDYMEWTQDSNVVIDIADWNGDMGEFWVYDSDSGWYYWAYPLAAGQQTDKVLDAIKLLEDPDGKMEYQIKASMDAISADLVDRDKWDVDDSANKDALNGLIDKIGATSDIHKDFFEEYGTNPPSQPDGYVIGEFNGFPAVVDADGKLVVDAVNFPDEGFREWVANEHGTIITEAEANAIELIKVVHYEPYGGYDILPVYSSKGAEYFLNVKRIDLPLMDVGSSELDLRVFAVVEEIAFTANASSLNISGMQNLRHFYNACGGTPLAAGYNIDKIDASDCPVLESVDISLTGSAEIDFSNSTSLERIWIHPSLGDYTDGVSSIDLTGCTSLVGFYAMHFKFAALDIPSTELESLDYALGTTVSIAGTSKLENIMIGDSAGYITIAGNSQGIAFNEATQVWTVAAGGGYRVGSAGVYTTPANGFTVNGLTGELIEL